jgi:hypothetical protein
MNRTLLEKAHCMLFNAGLGKEFWAEAVSTACYLVNRSPTTSIECKTPEKVWSGKPANYSNLKVFGCPAYFHVNEGKLESRAKKGIFIGYRMNVKGYKLWCPNLSKFLILRDITFDESVMLKVHNNSSKPIIKENEKIENKVEFDLSVQQSDEEEPMSHDDAHLEEEQEVVEQPYSLERDRERREIQQPARYADFVYYLAIVEEVKFSEPSSYKKAISSKDATDWVAAMNEEIHSLERNQT